MFSLWQKCVRVNQHLRHCPSPWTHTHSREQRLHVLIGVCYRGQVNQISVEHLLVPFDRINIKKDREMGRQYTAKTYMHDSVEPESIRYGTFVWYINDNLL